MGAVFLATALASSERAADPWACTMLGGALIRGAIRERDPERARKVLAQSCHLGADDPACVAANRLLKELDPGH